MGRYKYRGGESYNGRYKSYSKKTLPNDSLSMDHDGFFQRLTILRPPVGSVFRDLSFKKGPGLFWDDFGMTLGSLWDDFGLPWGRLGVTLG